MAALIIRLPDGKRERLKDLARGAGKARRGLRLLAKARGR